MLRRSVVFLGRPKGPPGLRPGKEYRLTVPYRSEVTMLKTENKPVFNTNIRELFKKPLVMNNLKAIPRDLGELPRNFLIKLLFFHQPIRLLDLWEVCKQQEDVPLDSAKHLRLVLKVARLQKWVYTEKNQTNNMYYYYVHQSRTHEVQKMVRADEVARKEQENRAAEEAEGLQSQAEAEQQSSLDSRIQAMQNILAHNIGSIRDYDPQYVEEKPYVTESGAVNFTWHRNHNAANTNE
ncbi:hypothetical protein AGDE_03336 [Angomonas deanei]|uniref:Uncharacterized protein n=1 Tax=Angomonas deanei TaxID=59799 RepID=S9VCG9_9TRYP|nr:hypothetical protein AGDE_10327 [Angomonas deanei]EPY39212.1 hypothetical protein AGDE_04716 [Angomonas deanei]EPY40592.1 hypothetical protein AGDE_03336 [Angomonas deanei]CAD2215248.1 hypothetical protein, conserved [Angomonas deanei]|eukprot:EPY28698.1 hypothetical protein AGDE_10327 [Angomonas deanei]